MKLYLKLQKLLTYINILKPRFHEPIVQATPGPPSQPPGIWRSGVLVPAIVREPSLLPTPPHVCLQRAAGARHAQRRGQPQVGGTIVVRAGLRRGVAPELPRPLAPPSSRLQQ